MYHLFRHADRQDNERWSMPTFAYEFANVAEKHEITWRVKSCIGTYILRDFRSTFATSHLERL